MVSTGGATQTILDANNNNRFIILAFNNEDAVTVLMALPSKMVSYRATKVRRAVLLQSMEIQKLI